MDLYYIHALGKDLDQMATLYRENILHPPPPQPPQQQTGEDK